MSDSKHTKGPWKVFNEMYIYKGKRLVLTLNDDVEELDQLHEDAARMVLCLNALDGINDVEGFMKLIKGVIEEGRCLWCTTASGYQIPGKICSYCQLEALDLFPKDNPKDE